MQLRRSILPLLWLLALLPPLLFAGCKPSEHPLETGASQAKFHCPMHPTVVSDKPGSCSICGMDLVPIQEGGQAAADMPKSDVPGLAVVSIAPEKRRTMGLKLGTVETRPLAREIRTSARIVEDETRLWRVTTKVEGWVEELYVSYTGQKVKKGDPLLTIYSPELLSAQAEYITLHGDENTAGGLARKPLIAAARRKLQLLDVSEEQLDRLARTRQVEKTLTLYAPASGIVLQRSVLPGQKLMQGAPLMVIADLSLVWGDADIYQSDVPYIQEGMPLEMSLPYWPGKVFHGKVIFVSPTVDEQSRTLRARIEIPNLQMLLKPGMYGDARIFYDMGEKLSIPASAVMLAGQGTYAFRDLGDGHLVPVKIDVGTRSDGFYELLGGMKEGEKVVTSANFLVDSESNLKAALEAATGTQSHAGHGSIAAVPEEAADAQVQLSKGELDQALSAYLLLQSALASDDLHKARDAANKLPETLKSAAAMREAETLDALRVHFSELSEILIAAAPKLRPSGLDDLFVAQCSMANDSEGGVWLQSSDKIQNPYFGQAMLKCGEIKGKTSAVNGTTEASHSSHL